MNYNLYVLSRRVCAAVPRNLKHLSRHPLMWCTK